MFCFLLFVWGVAVGLCLSLLFFIFHLLRLIWFGHLLLHSRLLGIANWSVLFYGMLWELQPAAICVAASRSGRFQDLVLRRSIWEWQLGGLCFWATWRGSRLSRIFCSGMRQAIGRSQLTIEKVLFHVQVIMGKPNFEGTVLQDCINILPVLLLTLLLLLLRLRLRLLRL